MLNELSGCRVCGFVYQDFMPWGKDGVTASFDMCVCCGVDFGYEDCLPESTRQHREIWTKAGYPWTSKARRPMNWSVEAQLANIPDRFK